MDLTEGRSTGIPTVQDELQKNGSPRATIETNDERSFINVFVPIHEGCGDKVILNDTENIFDTKGETKNVTKESECVTKDVTKENKNVIKADNQGVIKSISKRKSKNVTKDLTVDVIKEPQYVTKELSERQEIIISLIRQNPLVTTQEMSLKIGVVSRTIKRDIKDLQSKGIITREGGRKEGRWVIIKIPY